MLFLYLNVYALFAVTTSGTGSTTGTATVPSTSTPATGEALGAGRTRTKTAAVSTSTSLAGTTTTEICAFEEGMDNPTLINDEQIKLNPAGKQPSDIRPSSESPGWNSQIPDNNDDLPTASDQKPSVTIDLTPKPESEAPLVEKVVFNKDSNVKQITILRITPSNEGIQGTSPASLVAGVSGASKQSLSSSATKGTTSSTITGSTVLSASSTEAGIPGKPVTLGPFSVPASGDVVLPSPIRMEEIIIILEKPVDETKDYTVKLGIHACFKLHGKSTFLPNIMS